MIFEIVSSAFMGSIALYAKYKQAGIGNDGDKLNKIFTLTGLNVKDGQKTYTTELLKKVNHSWGTEYRYRIPLGYILIQLFPLFVKILEQVGKSL